MAKITLQPDERSAQSMDDLMKYYNLNSRCEVIAKALSVLKVVAHVGRTNGELIARKNGEESIIKV